MNLVDPAGDLLGEVQVVVSVDVGSDDEPGELRLAEVAGLGPIERLPVEVPFLLPD